MTNANTADPQRRMIGVDGRWFQCQSCQQPCRGIQSFTAHLSECCYAPMRMRSLLDIGPEITRP